MWLQALPHKAMNWQALRRYFETVGMDLDGSNTLVVIHLFPNSSILATVTGKFSADEPQ